MQQRLRRTTRYSINRHIRSTQDTTPDRKIDTILEPEEAGTGEGTEA